MASRLYFWTMDTLRILGVQLFCLLLVHKIWKGGITFLFFLLLIDVADRYRASGF